MRDTKHEIVHFWFEETEPQLWFQNNPQFDAIIKDRFSVTYEMAKEGLSNHWAADEDGALALCIVLDQFPRRIFRDRAAAYETDEKALLIAKQAVNRGFDKLMRHEKRFFLYMPYEHSERMSDQKRNLELFKAMEKENPLAYAHAQRKYKTMEKFGRFPERNAALGRATTPEEQAYLDTYGGFK
jgi:uncharacterized protein (DUF924 family)